MKRYLFKDSQNRTAEVSSFDPSDFIDSFNVTFGLPVKTNSSGVIDPSLIPSVGAAATLQVTRTASEAIAKGDCLYSVSSTHVGVATNNPTLARAIVIGLALNSASAGQSVGVILLGAIVDPIFSVFSVNQLLYLDEDGGLTDTKPLTGFLTPVAKALGSNTIFISIGYPTQLGA
jgi:hypothetical protein